MMFERRLLSVGLKLGEKKLQDYGESIEGLTSTYAVVILVEYHSSNDNEMVMACGKFKRFVMCIA
jgi:hypothetical protein